MSRFDNHGISTVVGAILVLGLIVSVAAVVKLTYVPDVKKQLEADHMQEVIDGFSGLKAQMDTMQAMTASGSGYASTSRIPMGGGSLPGLDPSTTSGTLTLDPDYGSLDITAYDYVTGNLTPRRASSPIGRLTYQSNNKYYADQQITWEGGMIVLSQPSGSVMLSPPPLAASRESDPLRKPVFIFNPQRLNGTPQALSSSTVATVRASLYPANNVYSGGNVTNATITLVSDHAPIWASYFRSSLADAGLAEGTNFVLTTPDSRTMSLFIVGDGPTVGLYVTDSLFNAGLGTAGVAVGPPLPTPVPSATPSPSPPSSPTILFESTSYAGAEGSTIPVMVLRAGNSSGEARVDYAITGGDATPANYTISPSPGTITFGDGESSKEITITAIDNPDYGGDRTIILWLSNAVNASLGGQTSTTVTIQENDLPYTNVQFASATYTAEEGAGPVQVVVSRTGNTGITSRVEYYRNGGSASYTGDYSLSPAPGILTFNPGETTKTITVTVVDDSAAEQDETAILALRNPVGCAIAPPTSTTVTINDNELYSYAITASNPWSPTASDNITVTARARSGRTLTGYLGGVYFTSNRAPDTFTYYDSSHAYTFTAGDNGVHVFDGDANLVYRNGMHTVTVRSVPGSVTASVNIRY
jgi:hypothetical protein